MSNRDHYSRVYSDVRAAGFHEPISLAEDWRGRADALYAQINAAGLVPSCIGLLPDGRMAAYAREPLGAVDLYAVTE